MKKQYSYKNIDVWRRSHELTLKVYRYSSSFPASETYALQSQIRRAVVSVPSNIVEGLNRSNTQEKLRFINIAQSSLAELDYQLFLSMELEYGDCTELLSEIEEIQKMLSSFYRAIQENGTRKH